MTEQPASHAPPPIQLHQTCTPRASATHVRSGSAYKRAGRHDTSRGCVALHAQNLAVLENIGTLQVCIRVQSMHVLFLGAQSRLASRVVQATGIVIFPPPADIGVDGYTPSPHPTRVCLSVLARGISPVHRASTLLAAARPSSGLSTGGMLQAPSKPRRAAREPSRPKFHRRLQRQGAVSGTLPRVAAPADLGRWSVRPALRAAALDAPCPIQGRAASRLLTRIKRTAASGGGTAVLVEWGAIRERTPVSGCLRWGSGRCCDLKILGVICDYL